MDFTSAAELLAIDGHTHAHLDCTSAAELLTAGSHTHAYGTSRRRPLSFSPFCSYAIAAQ
jgi:hypothetical protein